MRTIKILLAAGFLLVFGTSIHAQVQRNETYLPKFAIKTNALYWADPKYRVDESSLNNIFVRMSNGEMAPLSQFVTLTRSYGAESLSRFNMFNSIAVNAMPAEGYSTGDAIRAVQETAVQALPKGFGYDFGGITREETDQGGTTIIIFAICFLMIYLILSALYESFLKPVCK